MDSLLALKLLSEDTRSALEKARSSLDLGWLDLALLGEALTTRGCLGGHARHPFRNQQHLELLGDGVLRAIVRLHLFTALRVEVAQLARLSEVLVENKALALVGTRLGLDRYAFLGAKQPLGEGFYADTYEALVGACFVGGGYDKAEAFVRRTYLDHLTNPT